MKTDLHPEDLLERERRGALGAEERLRLDDHSRQCAACALARRAKRDFADLLEPFAGDDVIVSRLVSSVLGESGRSRLRAARRWNRFGLLVAAVLATGIAAAAVYSVVAPRWRSGHVAPSAPSASASRALGERGRGAGPGSVARAEQTVDQPITAVPSASESAQPGGSGQPAPSASESGRPAAPRASAASTDSGLDAAELFARGNRARRSGAYGEAVRHYGELQRRFPASREARTSQLALGWLLLNQLGDARGALAQFNGYLGGGGVMSEEAAAGRALALGRLGRSSEERRAWQELLARYPSSVYAERARQRLEALK